MKNYICEIETCNRSVPIRSTVKTGTHKGKKVCTPCKNSLEPKPFKKSKPVKKITEKTKLKRKEERKGLPEFFSKSIAILKIKPVCENCGNKIKHYLHPTNNIAHILKKETYKSVMANRHNFIFLCDSKDNENGKSCHREFDNNLNDRPYMPVFEIALIRYRLFKDDCVEMGVEKLIYDENL